MLIAATHQDSAHLAFIVALIVAIVACVVAIVVEKAITVGLLCAAVAIACLGWVFLT